MLTVLACAQVKKPTLMVIPADYTTPQSQTSDPMLLRQ